jgi:hypothetical protein
MQEPVILSEGLQCPLVNRRRTVVQVLQNFIYSYSTNSVGRPSLRLACTTRSWFGKRCFGVYFRQQVLCKWRVHFRVDNSFSWVFRRTSWCGSFMKRDAPCHTYSLLSSFQQLFRSGTSKGYMHESCLLAVEQFGVTFPIFVGQRKENECYLRIAWTVAIGDEWNEKQTDVSKSCLEKNFEL